MTQDYAIRRWYQKHNKYIPLPKNPYDEVFSALQSGVTSVDQLNLPIRPSRPQFQQLLQQSYTFRNFAENYQYTLRREKVMEKVAQVTHKSYDEKRKILSQLFNIQDIKIRNIQGRTLNRKFISKSVCKQYDEPYLLPKNQLKSTKVMKFKKVINYEPKEDSIWQLRNFVEGNKQIRSKSMFLMDQLKLNNRYL